MEGTVLLGLATVLGMGPLVYAVLSLARGDSGFRGIHKRFWCDGKQRLVDVDFMAVNPNVYDVASCTAFSVEDCISCDKHCVKIVQEDTARAVGKGIVPNQVFEPQPAFPGNGR